MGNDEPTDDPLIEWLRDTVGPGPFVPQSIYGAVLATLSALDAARFRLEAVTTDWKFEVRRAQSWRLAADTWQQRAEAAEAETLRLRTILDEADTFVEWGVEYGAGVNVYDEQADAEEWAQWLVQPNQVVRRDVYRTPWVAAVLGGTE